MNCDCIYCIYNKDFLCVIKEITVNSLGMCEDCIIVRVPQNDLNQLKQKQLEDIEKRWIPSP